MSSYNQFYWYDRQLDSEYIEEKEKEGQMFRDLPITEFIEMVSKVTDLELRLLFNISYEWHDEQMSDALKKEFRKRGLAWS